MFLKVWKVANIKIIIIHTPQLCFWGCIGVPPVGVPLHLFVPVRVPLIGVTWSFYKKKIHQLSFNWFFDPTILHVLFKSKIIIIKFEIFTVIYMLEPNVQVIISCNTYIKSLSVVLVLHKYADNINDGCFSIFKSLALFHPRMLPIDVMFKMYYGYIDRAITY